MALIIAIVALIGISAASTVTLTGTCYASLINQTNNYLQFNLTNSGNGTASNLVIEPVIDGASPTNATISLSLVAPGTTYPEKVYLNNFGIPGSYVERFVVSYSQGSASYITIFPCLVDIGQSAQSLLGITSITKSGNHISANISNIADYPITANVVVFSPPSFSISQPFKNVTVNQYSLTNVSFSFGSPKYTNAQFPIVIAVSYLKDGVHYATLGVATITFGSGSGSQILSLGNNLILIVVGIVVIVILALIIFSAVRNKGGRKEGKSHGTGNKGEADAAPQPDQN